MSFILPIYKESGMTSFDVVYKIRKIIGVKKIGHAGTLDPMATGVLPVLVDNAAKLTQYLKTDKKYIAEIKFGIKTDTDDITGNILLKEDFDLSKIDIESVLLSFKGKIMQKPPMYSAIKVGGRKLYELARKGETVDVKEREIEIYDISLISRSNDTIKIEVSCSGGTYIRTLAADIGAKCGTCATMSSLLRTSACNIDINNTVSLKTLENCDFESVKQYSITPEKYFEFAKELKFPPESITFVKNGGKIDLYRVCGTISQGEILRAYDDKDNFLGLCTSNDGLVYLIWQNV